MIISSMQIEILTTAGAEITAEPHELEIAAAAAVISYSSNSVEQYQTTASRDNDTERGGWKRAACQESTSSARILRPQNFCKIPAWQVSGFFKGCLLVLLTCLTLACLGGSTLAQSAQIELRPLPADQSQAECFPADYVKKTYSYSPSTISNPKAARIDHPGPTMYKRITPAQGYPFVTGGSVPPTKQAQTSTKQYLPVVQSDSNWVSEQSQREPATYTTTIETPTSQESKITKNNKEPTQSIPTPQYFQPVNTSARRENSNATSRFLQSTTEREEPDSDSLVENGATQEFQIVKNRIGAETAAATPVMGMTDPDLKTLVQDSTQFNPAVPTKKTIIKIGLCFCNTRMDFAAIDGAEIHDAASGAFLAKLQPISRWDVAVHNSGKITQLALYNKQPGQEQPPANSEGMTSAAYGESSKYRNVAFFPSPAPLPSQHCIRLPLRLLSLDALKPIAQCAPSSSGYIISPRTNDTNAVLVVNGKLYRGSIWLRPVVRLIDNSQYRACAFDVINLVDIEDYLLSVVPSEMPSNWPLEALKAQAIAARSYAIANIGKHAKDDYDLRATIEDQVYSGVSSENDNSNLAVAQTNGMVLKHEGKPITAFFHSTSGGSTEFSEYVWGKSLPYLKRVQDFDDASPHFSWTRKISVDDLEKCIGTDIGSLLSLSIVARTGSKRAQYLLAQGTNGSHLMTGELFRRLCKLPSTLFNVGNEANAYIFAGRGFGHGLGMSQYGAKSLAERGCNAAQILSYYYKDVIVDYTAASPSI